MSSSCTENLSEVDAVVRCERVGPPSAPARTGSHTDSRARLLTDCRWSPAQNPAARGIRRGPRQKGVGCSCPSGAWPSCWSGDRSSPAPVCGPFSQSCSRVPDSVSWPCPPPAGGSVPVQGWSYMKTFSEWPRCVWRSPTARRQPADWTVWPVPGGGIYI